MSYPLNDEGLNKPYRVFSKKKTQAACLGYSGVFLEEICREFRKGRPLGLFQRDVPEYFLSFELLYNV